MLPACVRPLECGLLADLISDFLCHSHPYQVCTLESGAPLGHPSNEDQLFHHSTLDSERKGTRTPVRFGCVLWAGTVRLGPVSSLENGDKAGA